jgi:predicted transcriptional regulator
MATELKRDEVTYSELKSGIKGIGLGEEFLFLQVERKRKLRRLRLMDLFSGDYLTGYVKLIDLEDLRHSRRGKPIRDELKAHWQNVDEIIEKILIEIESHEEEWRNKKRKETTSEEKVDFDESIVEKAWNLLRDPAFFYKLGKVFEQGFVIPKINKPRFIIGEERNKRLLGPLLTGASKLNMTSLIKLLGGIGTAKDTMLRMWLKLLPIKSIERSYMTAASLRYSDAMKEADLLYIPDSPELRGEVGRHLRFMRADDGGLISEYATRDSETGEMTTKITRLPVKGVATTSNVVTGDTALESGMWTLRTNDTEDLTGEVKREKLKLRAGKRPLYPEEDLKVWKYAFNILLTEELPQELPQVPFAESLINILESERSESRRDPDKLCDLISLIAWIRRFQKAPEERGEADFVDFYIALQIGLDAITQTIGELDEKGQKIFRAVQAGVMEEVTCRYVANETKIPYKTCYRYLEKLIEKGFMNKEKIKGRNIYSVSSGKKPKEFLITQGGIFDKPEQLTKFILESFGGFSLSHQETSVIFFVDPITGEKVNVTIGKDKEALITVEKNNISSPREKVRKPKRSKETASETENKLKEIPPSEMRKEKAQIQPPQQKPTGAVQCPICAKFNKPMFFANQHDLELHLMRLHSGYPIQVKADNSPATETAPEVKPEMLAEFSDEKVVSVGNLNPPSDQRECARCHKPKTLPKYAEYSDGAWAPICSKCAEALRKKLRERAPSKLASGDMLKVLRNKFPKNFVELEYFDCVLKHWTQAEAESFLNKLEKEGAVFKTSEGSFVWS